MHPNTLSLPGSVYWKHPVLLHTKEPVSKPLTTLPSVDLQDKALDLFKVRRVENMIDKESQACEMLRGLSPL